MGAGTTQDDSEGCVSFLKRVATKREQSKDFQLSLSKFWRIFQITIDRKMRSIDLQQDDQTLIPRIPRLSVC